MKTGTGTNRTLLDDTTEEYTLLDSDIAKLMMLADECEEDLAAKYPEEVMDN